MARSPYTGYRPKTGTPATSLLGQAGGPQIPDQFPAREMRPQRNIMATFDGKAVGWTGGPALTAGSYYNGSRVMSGTGAVPGLGAQTPQAVGPPQAQGQAMIGSAAAAQPTLAQQGSLIPAEIQAMMDKANAANEARYGQLLSNNQNDKKEVKGLLDTGYAGILQKQQAQADALKGKMESGWGEIFGLVGQDSTKAPLERERRRAAYEIGGNQQSMVNRGLTNSTILDSTRRGIVDDSALRSEEIMNAQRDKEVQARQNMLSQTIPTELRLNEAGQAIQQNQLSQTVPAMERANSDRQGFIERRQDEGPNLALYAQALAQQGASQQASQLAAQQAANANAGNSAIPAYQALLNSILQGNPQQQLGDGQPAQQRNTAGWSRPSDQQAAQNPYGGAFANTMPRQQQQPQQPAQRTYTYQDKQAAAQFLKLNGKPVSAQAVADLLASGWDPRQAQDALPVNDLNPTDGYFA